MLATCILRYLSCSCWYKFPSVFFPVWKWEGWVKHGGRDSLSLRGLLETLWQICTCTDGMHLGFLVRLWTSILQALQCQARRGEGARWAGGDLLPSRRLSNNSVSHSLVRAFEHQVFGNSDSQADWSCNSTVGEGLLSLPRLLHASSETQSVQGQTFQFTTPTSICYRMCGMWVVPPRVLHGVHSALAWRSELCWVPGPLAKWASLGRPEAPPTCEEGEMAMLQKMRPCCGTCLGL